MQSWIQQRSPVCPAGNSGRAGNSVFTSLKSPIISPGYTALERPGFLCGPRVALHLYPAPSVSPGGRFPIPRRPSPAPELPALCPGLMALMGLLFTLRAELPFGLLKSLFISEQAGFPLPRGIPPWHLQDRRNRVINSRPAPGAAAFVLLTFPCINSTTMESGLFLSIGP